jgi:hypothetical protein
MSNESTQQRAERKTTMRRQAMKFQFSAIALGCAALISGCGGGGGSSSGNGGVEQSMTFSLPFSGTAVIGVPPATATATLQAQATSGGPVTFTSNTPDTCSVSGDKLSLLKAGECSVTATQAGYNGYAPVSRRQVIVIPKNPQKIVSFPNPGWQPVGAGPVQLSASFDTNLPVTFTTKTPTVCSVSGNTMTTLANGMCTVTANQAGTDIYAATTVDRNIPVGTELPAKLTFLSGYKDGDNTNEGGIGHWGNQWWCNECSHSASSDGSSFTFTGSFGSPPASWQYNHASFQIFGRNVVDDLDVTTNKDNAYRGFLLAAGFSNPTAPKGVQLDIQGGMHFNLAQNPEWFGSSNNKFNVELILAHFNPNKVDSNNYACAVTVMATVQPTAAGATDYNISLKNQFTLSQSCDLSGLDAWNELQSYPVVEIRFSAVQPNGQTASASGTYDSRFTLTGPIYFQ